MLSGFGWQYLPKFGRGRRIRTLGTWFWRWFALPLEIGVFTLLVALRFGGIRRKYDGYLVLPINESGCGKKIGAVYTPPLQNLQTQIFISLLLYAH